MRKEFLPVLIVTGFVSFGVNGRSSADVFSLPTALTSEFDEARTNVDRDLLKVEKAERDEAVAKVAKGASVLEQDTAVSRALKLKNEALARVLREDVGGSRRHSPGVSEAQANEIQRMFKTHPVIGDEPTLRYDTPMRQIGFCFGRATFAHWELLRRGVDARDIGKIFAVGNLFYQHSGWTFHVATIVRAKARGWYVIDPLQDKVMSYDDWSKKVTTWAQNPDRPELRFYLSDPIKFQPTPGAYSDQKLFIDVYHGYFLDLEKWFVDHPLKASDKFN